MALALSEGKEKHMGLDSVPGWARACLISLLPFLPPPAALAQSAPLGGSVGVSLVSGISRTGDAVTAVLLLDLSTATGTCGAGSVVPATLGAYSLGITYDPEALEYVGATSCGVPEFSEPACVDHGTFVNCTDVNRGATRSPQGAICVARLTFHVGRAASSSLAVLNTPPPRSIVSNYIVGCGGPATFPTSMQEVRTLSAAVPAERIRVKR